MIAKIISCPRIVKSTQVVIYVGLEGRHPDLDQCFKTVSQPAMQIDNSTSWPCFWYIIHEITRQTCHCIIEPSPRFASVRGLTAVDNRGAIFLFAVLKVWLSFWVLLKSE